MLKQRCIDSSGVLCPLVLLQRLDNIVTMGQAEAVPGKWAGSSTSTQLGWFPCESLLLRMKAPTPYTECGEAEEKTRSSVLLPLTPGPFCE